MKKKENPHNGCPNRHHCIKDDEKCCYLISNRQCLLTDENMDDFL